MNKIVKIHEDYVQKMKLPSDIGLVLRGPYEHVIKLTDMYESYEMMYDILIAGEVHTMVPVVYCSKLKR